MADENTQQPMDATIANGEDAGGVQGAQTSAHEAAQRSKKENRVYVGNLSYDVKWNILKDFMREGACRCGAWLGCLRAT